MNYSRVDLINVLTFHQQRASDSGCHCGWGVLGASWCEHVADVYEYVLRERAQHLSGPLAMAQQCGVRNGASLDWDCVLVYGHESDHRYEWPVGEGSDE